MLDNPPPPGISVKAAGIINSLRTTQTKSGKAMCQFSLEDATGAVEVVLFPKVYEQVSAQISCNRIVVISGQINVNEGGLKIIAASINVLRHRHKVREVRITIDTKKYDDAFYQGLCSILSSHQGGSEVILIFPDHGLKLQVDPKYWIEASAEALKEIETMVGKENVELIFY